MISDANFDACLPQGTLAIEPTEFLTDGYPQSWIFVSRFDRGDFHQWSTDFEKCVRAAKSKDQRMSVHPYPDVGGLCIDVRFRRGLNGDPIEIHAAQCSHPIGYDNFYAWLGSEVLERLSSEHEPSTIGLIRVRDDLAFVPDELRG